MKPKGCITEAAAEVKDAPRVPDGAGFPAPLTPQERQAVALYTTWLTMFGQDNKDKTERLRKIQTSCSKR